MAEEYDLNTDELIGKHNSTCHGESVVGYDIYFLSTFLIT